MGSSSNNWIILQYRDSNAFSFTDVKNSLENIFGDHSEFFIPIHHEQVGAYTSTSVLFDGYAFIKDVPEIRDRLNDLYDSKIFIGPLTYSNQIQVIDDGQIQGFRKQLVNMIRKSFKQGTKVKIIEGSFKNLTGVVIGMEETDNRVIIRISRPSREIIAPMPVTSVVEEL